jgi:outer membrane biosynthesis protein TonB
VAPAAAASRPKNATPEMFYKKDTDDDENIISGIDEDLGESDVEMALEPIEKPKPKPAPVPEKKKAPTPQRKEEKPAAPKQEKQEDVKNITNIFYQD